MKERRINGNVVLPAGVLLLWVLSACFCMAVPTVVVNETFDSVADVTYSTGTATVIANTDAGDWTYSLGDNGGTCGFSGGKAFRSSIGTGDYASSVYEIFHNPSGTIDTFTTVTISFTLDVQYLGAHGGLISNFILRDKDDNILYMVQHRGDTRKWEWFARVGAVNALITPTKGTQVAHELQVSCSFCPQFDGTTNVTFDIVDLTDGTGSRAGTLNVAADAISSKIDESYIIIAAKMLCTVDNWNVTVEPISSGASNWQLLR